MFGWSHKERFLISFSISGAYCAILYLDILLIAYLCYVSLIGVAILTTP